MIAVLSAFRRRLLKWYDRNRRELPWRSLSNTTGLPEPYSVLVSEIMLQQTQVATVIPYFLRFMERFPTLASLAQAEEQEVLRLWQGLGYYSRARNLLEAARRIIRDHDGDVPADAPELLALPGIGRYTAGAVASIAFCRRVPILDGNVARVLCRLDRIETDPRDRETQARLWERAEELLPKTRTGDFNSALMELGAILCTPRSPRCLLCPVRKHCQAYAAGLQEKIPAPRKARPTPLHRRWIYCISQPRTGQWLIEQRPPRGRWAGMWQFITLEAGDGLPDAPLNASVPLRTGPITRIGSVAHALTHRRYVFDVFTCRVMGRIAKASNGKVTRRWVTLDELAAYPLPRPHVKVAQMLRASM